MKATPTLKLSGVCLLAGILFGVGTRIGQWLIPVPDTRILVCTPEDAETYEACATVGAEGLVGPAEADEENPFPPQRQSI